MKLVSIVAAATAAFVFTSTALAQDASNPAPDDAVGKASEFDLNELAGLLNGQDREAMRRAPTAEERATQIVRDHMRSCWQAPVDLAYPERLVVTLQFDLNEDGTLRGEPRVISPRSYRFNPPMRLAVDGALAAVRRCSPFPFAADPMLSHRYDVWREIELVFQPIR